MMSVEYIGPRDHARLGSECRLRNAPRGREIGLAAAELRDLGDLAALARNRQRMTASLQQLLAQDPEIDRKSVV